jgi:hypothetical protein
MTDQVMTRTSWPDTDRDIARKIARDELYRAWRAARVYDTVEVVDADPTDIGYTPGHAKLHFYTMDPAEKRGQLNVISVSEDEARELRAQLGAWLNVRATYPSKDAR